MSIEPADMAEWIAKTLTATAVACGLVWRFLRGMITSEAAKQLAAALEPINSELEKQSREASAERAHLTERVDEIYRLLARNHN